MKFLNFVKEEWVLILIALAVIGVACCVICLISEIDEPIQATTILSEPLTENNEPTTEEVTVTETTKTVEEEFTEEETARMAELEPLPDTYKYYDVPLDADLQNHIVDVCGYYNVDPGLVIAIIQKESNFDPITIGDNGASYGLMQVQPYWHEPRMTQLGCHDLLDPYQNVRVGVDILAELFGKFDDITWVLMAYNGGESYATEMRNNGQMSEYVRLVLKYRSELRNLYYG